MPLDALFLTGLLREISQELIGTRIDKVYQPENDEIILLTRAGRLLISAGSSPRLHMTSEARENPASPPMFCMLLRKHISSARIMQINQHPLERAVDIVLETTDEMGFYAQKTLTVELIGRQSNIVLRDSENRIIDCLRRIDADISSKRALLSGLYYKPPAKPDKLNPFTVGKSTFLGMISKSESDIFIDKWLCSSFFAMSPLVCREIAHRALGSSSILISQIDERGRVRLADVFAEILIQIGNFNFHPTLLLERGHPAEYYMIPITQYGAVYESRAYDNFSKLLEDFYLIRERAQRMRRKSGELFKSVSTIRDRTARKLALQTEELNACEGRERLRQLGDILTSNLHAIERGSSRVTLADYFSEDYTEVEIQLDPRLTPQQNAAKYYKDYNKLKNAETILTRQMELGRIELTYLDSVLEELSRAGSSSDLLEISDELRQAGYLKRGKVPKKSPRPAAPLEFLSSEGFRIFAGRNNRQNDELTMKLAARTDIWLHTQKIHGCHVIIDCASGPPGDRTLQEAAMIAAFYSQAKDSAHVPVDYTQVKYVKKPSGSKPGMVIYDKFKTLSVNPDENLINSLKKK